MTSNCKMAGIALAAMLVGNLGFTQSVETYAGNNRTGIDIMWFKKTKNLQDQPTAFLFFSRNRASIDYENSPTVFGSTNAVSYNFKNGLGVVAVAQFLTAGITPKAGIQYYRQKGNFMFFGWLVADIKSKGAVDLFGLFRYQPGINKHWKIFSQLEIFPVYNPKLKIWNLTQRVRLGAKYNSWAAGLMTDLNETGKTNFIVTENIGGFLRYEF